MKIDQSTDGAGRCWAGRMLGLEEQKGQFSPPTLLRLAAKFDYELTSDSIELAKIVFGHSNVDSSVMIEVSAAGQEMLLAEEVERFANGFFELSSNQRRDRCHQLRCDCAEHPSLLNWLDDLTAGINIAKLPTSDDERLSELIGVCVAVFVAKRPGKIRKRQAFMSKCREQPRIWEPIARRLLSENLHFVVQAAPWVREIPLSAIREYQGTLALRDQLLKENKNAEPDSGSKSLLVICVFFVIGTIYVFLLPPNEPPRVRPFILHPTALKSLSFETFEPEILDALGEAFPGFRDAISEPKLRLELGLLMDQNPDFLDAIRRLFGTKARRNRTTLIDADLTPAGRAGLNKFKRILATSSSNRGSNQADVFEHPVSALTPENMSGPHDE